ncbi:MAG: ABC transporter ATP-binding protein [Candidatus Omnitrophica bacterium]|nr:ABC transporter ATP-binding protein [Candidatus Omnitrophota bacterium]
MIDITSGYDGTDIIRGVSFKVDKGEFIGIIGPNGSGKSTLLKSLSRILSPRNGSILFEGKDINSWTTREFARRAAFVPPDITVSFSFRVEEVVSMGRNPYMGRFASLTDSDKNYVDAAMELTRTINLRDRFINELSTGETQRVIIAQAIAQETGTILLDEPTSHLDIGHQTEIFDLLKKLQKEKEKTIILISHDLNMASEYSDRLILMQNGMVYKIGLPGEVLDYKTIEEVYNAVVVVRDNPASGRPHVLPVSKWALRR